jgi:hypothetical protein
MNIFTEWVANAWKVSFRIWTEQSFINRIASLLVNLGSDHTFAMCGRRTIDVHSSKGSSFIGCSTQVEHRSPWCQMRKTKSAEVELMDNNQYCSEKPIRVSPFSDRDLTQSRYNSSE